MGLYEHGIPLPIIMRLLGHENASTKVYAFATMDMMREALDAATPAITTPATEHLTEESSALSTTFGNAKTLSQGIVTRPLQHRRTGNSSA